MPWTAITVAAPSALRAARVATVMRPSNRCPLALTYVTPKHCRRTRCWTLRVPLNLASWRACLSRWNISAVDEYSWTPSFWPYAVQCAHLRPVDFNSGQRITWMWWVHSCWRWIDALKPMYTIAKCWSTVEAFTDLSFKQFYSRQKNYLGYN
jgi:hypothetical protein